MGNLMNNEALIELIRIVEQAKSDPAVTKLGANYIAVDSYGIIRAFVKEPYINKKEGNIWDTTSNKHILLGIVKCSDLRLNWKNTIRSLIPTI